jgi:hypothetical protein
MSAVWSLTGEKRTSSSDAVTSKKWAQEWSWHHLPKEQAIYNQLFAFAIAKQFDAFTPRSAVYTAAEPLLGHL